MTRTIKIFFPLLFLFLLNGCKAPEMLQFKGVSGVKLEKDKVNNQLELHVGLKFFNPNKYSLLLKKTKLNVMVNNVVIGEARGKFRRQKVDGNKEGMFELVISTDRDKLLKAAVGSLLKILSGNKTVKLKVDGYLKGGIFMLGKKFPVELEKDINLNLKDLNL